MILLLSIQVCAFAAEMPVFMVSTAESSPGETVALTVETMNNPGIASFDLRVEYDSSRLEWIDVEKGNLKGTMDVAVGHTLTWFDADNHSDDTTIAILYFKVKPNAISGEAWVSVSFEEGDVFDIYEKDVRFSVIKGGITVKADESVNPNHARVNEFVTRLYRNFLEREPDEAGLASWSELLISGKTTGSKVVCGFVYSKEFQDNPLDNEAFVEAMYETILGRKPDTSGLNSWVVVLERGCTRKKILSGFLNSEEMKNLCNSIGIQPGSYESDEMIDQHTMVTYFVSRLYEYCFERQADYSGLTSWVTALVEGNATGTKIATGFFFSPEMEQRGLNDRDFVSNAYRALLNREPDANGLESWIGVLARDNDRTRIVYGFVKSIEFANLCDEYGIVR